MTSDDDEVILVKVSRLIEMLRRAAREGFDHAVNSAEYEDGTKVELVRVHNPFVDEESIQIEIEEEQ